MKILVAAPESSGGQWVCRLLKLHPDAPEVEHNSYPAGWMPTTIMPDYTDDTSITHLVICLRDWTITRMSQKQKGYLDDHPPEMTDEENIREALLREALTDGRRVYLLSYEGLCGPLGVFVMANLLKFLGLDPEKMPWREFRPKNENQKYLDHREFHPAVQ